MAAASLAKCQEPCCRQPIGVHQAAYQQPSKTISVYGLIGGVGKMTGGLAVFRILRDGITFRQDVAFAPFDLRWVPANLSALARAFRELMETAPPRPLVVQWDWEIEPTISL